MFYLPFIENSVKQVAALVDPEKATNIYLQTLISVAERSNLDWFFVGGSTVTNEDMDRVVRFIKANSKIPLIVFPGSVEQVHPLADGLLFLSLLSGRNPEYLIGQQVKSAFKISELNLAVIPTAYIIIDGGKSATASSVSHTEPLIHPDEILSTALAGQLMGMKAIYIEAGSGAQKSVSIEILAMLKEKLQVKLIVGGGIKDAFTAKSLSDAGADVVVIGNALEENVLILESICKAIKQ